MKEYWKTHKIMPPDKDVPFYIIGRIIEGKFDRWKKKLQL